jgi:Fe-S cluster biogenesis protein NfuA
MVNRELLQKTIDEVRPYLQQHGGDCELVDVTDEGVVKLRLQGACSGCPSSTYTIRQGIREHLIENVPGVTDIEQVQ